MAIRLANIKFKGKRIKNEETLKVVDKLNKLLKENEIEATITISKYYGDRWYTPERYKLTFKSDFDIGYEKLIPKEF